MGRTVEYIKIVEEDLRRGCRTKTAIPYGRDSCIAWNRCHIFTNKRGTYGIIADDLRFNTQLSNVYRNAIRHARCQKLFLFSLSVAKQVDSAENAHKKSVAVTVVRPLLRRNLLISLCMKIKILFELLR